MSTITGTATNANGLPLPNASIMLLGGGIEPRIALTGIDGVCTFTEVPAGRYKLTAVVSHSVTEHLAIVTPNQVASTVVNFTILFFNPIKTVFDYFQINRFLLLKYFQYGFLAMIAYFFFSDLVGDQIGLLGIEKLESPEKARGVITYLIAVTTVGMATLLMVASIMIGGKEVKERFALGKEILTLLIGILGTIIGFYYGSTNKTTTQTNADSTALVNVSPLVITSSEDQKILTIKGKIEGGVLPYTYKTVSDKENLFDDHKVISSTDGVISEELVLKKTPTDDIPVSFTLTGLDKNKRSFKRVKVYTITKLKVLPADSAR